jgi:hypothetical protein
MFGDTILPMVALSLLQWWYGHGWLSAVEHSEQRLKNTYRLFSIPILLRTLFSPWRRIITTPGASIGDHIRAAVDNAVSRMIGFIVRLIVLLTAGLLLLLASILSLLELLSWPLIPLAVIGLPIAVGVLA